MEWKTESDFIGKMVKKYFKIETAVNQESYLFMQDIFKEAKEKVDSGIVYSTGKKGLRFEKLPNLHYEYDDPWLNQDGHYYGDEIIDDDGFQYEDDDY